MERVITRRRELAGRRRRRSGLASSLALHALLVATVLLVPLLTAGESEPLEFVPIQIVPAQALGVSEPEPETPRSSPPQAGPTRPEPDPAKPEPSRSPAPTEEPANRPAPVETSPAPTPREQEAPPTPRRPAQRQGSPTGSSTGTSAFGTAIAGLENPEFRYSYYVDQMLAMISAAWRQPVIGGTIEAIIYFRIHQDGAVSALRVNRSSGYSSFDLAGLRAVRQAAPFPPLPQSYRRDTLGVNLILRNQ